MTPTADWFKLFTKEIMFHFVTSHLSSKSLICTSVNTLFMETLKSRQYKDDGVKVDHDSNYIYVTQGFRFLWGVVFNMDAVKNVIFQQEMTG